MPRRSRRAVSDFGVDSRQSPSSSCSRWCAGRPASGGDGSCAMANAPTGLLPGPCTRRRYPDATACAMVHRVHILHGGARMFREPARGPWSSVAGTWTMRANSSGSRLAPPTRAPSMSGWAISSAMLPDFTQPPYWMRTAAAVGPSVTSAICAADRRAHGLGVLGRRGPAGADRPDRLVGDDQRGDLRLRSPGERGVDLAEHLRLGLRRPRAPRASRRRRRSASCRGAGSAMPSWRPSRRSRRTARVARCGRR